jgi:hypothetical protein
LTNEIQKLAVNTFKTHDGKLFLKHLVDLCQRCKLYDENPQKMAYRVGQYELVEYLKDLSRGKEDE